MNLFLGPAALAIRLFLVWVGGLISATGLGMFDEVGGTITLSIDSMTNFVIGILTVFASFVWSRMAKKRGGIT